MTDAQIRFRQLKEAIRHDQAQESYWGGQLMETRRSNQAKEWLSRYATDVQAETSRYNAELQAETTRYVTDVNAATSRYATEVSAGTSVYRTDIESADRQKRLEFDTLTQDVKNAMASRQLDLQTIETETNAELRKTQARRLVNETRMDLVRLSQAADRLGMEKEAQEVQNALNDMRVWESAMGGLKNLGGFFQHIDTVLRE
jgi:hypothetical protein